MRLPSSSEIHDLSVEEFDTSTLLAHASAQAHKRKYSEFLIVDLDSHHNETDHVRDIYPYIDDPVVRQTAQSFAQTMGLPMFPQRGNEQDMGGRITRSPLRKLEKTQAKGAGHDTALTLRWMDAMGVDYTCLFPTPMLSFGLHPQVRVEVALSRAYNRWLCDNIL